MGLFVFPMGALFAFSILTAPARQVTPPVETTSAEIVPALDASITIENPTPFPTIPVIQATASPSSEVFAPQNGEWGEAQSPDLAKVFPVSPPRASPVPRTRIRTSVSRQPIQQSPRIVRQSPQVPVAVPPPPGGWSQPQPQRTALPPAPAQGTQVWVNTKSGIYHYPGARWYGNTKNGRFMSESEALAKGYEAAENNQ